MPTIKWTYVYAFLFAKAMLLLYIVLRWQDIGTEVERSALLFVFFAINAGLGSIAIRAVGIPTPGTQPVGSLPVSQLVSNNHAATDSDTVNGTDAK